MLVAAYFLLLGSLVSKVQRVSRVWVVDNLSLAGYTYICCSCAVCFGSGGCWLVCTCILVYPSVV